MVFNSSWRFSSSNCLLVIFLFIKKYKTPVIIIIDEQKENLAKHFLDEGFANYILTSTFDEDLDTIINKY